MVKSHKRIIFDVPLVNSGSIGTQRKCAHRRVTIFFTCAVKAHTFKQRTSRDEREFGYFARYSFILATFFARFFRPSRKVISRTVGRIQSACIAYTLCTLSRNFVLFRANPETRACIFHESIHEYVNTKCDNG